MSAKFKKLRSELKNWSQSLSNLKLLIDNCNRVIRFLDGLEDRRSLFNTEFNTRRLIKIQLQTLLRYRNVYWKQRFTVNRIKYGDECTKFFHSIATISHRRNAISQIQNDQGAWIQDHEGKAGLLWNSWELVQSSPCILTLTVWSTPETFCRIYQTPYNILKLMLLSSRCQITRLLGQMALMVYFWRNAGPLLEMISITLLTTSLKVRQTLIALTVPLSHWSPRIRT